MTVRTRFRCIFERPAERMGAGDRFLDIMRVVRVNTRRDSEVRKGARWEGMGGMYEGDGFVRHSRRGEAVRGGRDVAVSVAGLDARDAAGDMADGDRPRFMDRGGNGHREEGEEEGGLEREHCGEDENY